MNSTKIKAYKKLSGHFPTQFTFIYFRGVRVCKRDFDEIAEYYKG